LHREFHIVEIGKRNHGASAHAAGDDALTYFANDVVRIDGAKASSLALEDASRAKLRRAERLWAR
jgi:hypothetical protein